MAATINRVTAELPGELINSFESMGSTKISGIDEADQRWMFIGRSG